MSTTKNVFRLNKYYDLVLSGCVQYTGSITEPSLLYAWGCNFCGQLGINTSTDRSSPVQIPGTSWTFISAENCTSFGIKSDNTLWGWGATERGVVDPTCIPRSSPIQIPGTSWTCVDVGHSQNVLALKSDNTLWAWGCNDYGGLGINVGGVGGFCSSPIQIPGTSWSKIAQGTTGGIATKTDGTLWTWGYNLTGQIGDNTSTNRSSPVQIPGTTWCLVSAGYNSNHALKTNGTLWSWGSNNSGRLGANLIAGTFYCYSSPVQVPGTTWVDIKAGCNHVLARKTDGTLWAWGYGANGELANDSTLTRSSPIQIPGTTWVDMASNNYTGFGKKSDNTLWGWGYNGRGALANPIIPSTGVSSPVQIPGTSWLTICGGRTFILARQL